MIKISSQKHTDRRNWMRFFALLLLLSLVCIGTAWKDIYANSRNTVTVENVDALSLSVNGHRVSQELRLEGTLEQVLLYCSAPNGAGYEDATITFTLQQGEEIRQISAQAADITSPYLLDVRGSQFQAGSAILTIEGSDFPEGTDLFFLTSQTQTSRLQSAQMDGNITPGPLLMHYTVLRHDGYFYYDTIMCMLLVLVIVVVSWLLAFYQERLSKGKWLFFCSFVLLFVYISLTNPLATFLAEPHSEMAYEFWYKARYLSFFENLMSLMSGESLVWTERLMMWAAVHMAGNGKYVFMIAQLMQTSMVCAVSSMLCLPTFRKFFRPEVRLLVCWYIGGAMLFPSAYYFWAVSYWACFFLVPFSFVDMERLHRWQYGLALAVTTILCISRIYHILLVPMALLALFAVGKKRGRRFSLYCVVVAAASTFEVVYSMLAGGSGHIDLALLKPLHFFENAVYYQIQLLNSLFFGNNSLHSIVVNSGFFLFFLAVIVLSLWLLIFNWDHIVYRTYGCVLTCIGILSFGSILINVTVCGCSNSVGFPIDYAGTIDWHRTYYQIADLHFSYTYFALVAILLILMSFLKQFTLQVDGKNVCRPCSQEMIACLLIIIFTAVNPQSHYTVRMIPTDWKSCYWVTENSSYYMPINVSYQFANISLYHNSSAIICGLTDGGEESLWSADRQAYSTVYAYSSASPGKVCDLPQRQMLSLSVQRKDSCFMDPLVLVLRQEDGTELARIAQTNSASREHVDFMLHEPISGVYSVEFVYEDGSPAYVCGGMQIGVAL